MESVVKLQYSHCKIAHTSWSFKHSNTHLLFPKTQTPKPSTTTTLSLCHAHFFSPSPLPPHKTSSSTKHTTLHVEPSHEYHKLRALLDILMEKDCCPLQLLRDDGDWTIDQFWAVIRFLIHASRPKEILQVRFYSFLNFQFACLLLSLQYILLPRRQETTVSLDYICLVLFMRM